MLFKKKQAADKAVVQNAATTLFANIKFADVDNPIRSMVVTSSIPNEGKTTVTVNLARAIAASGARVLLVECDMRRRSLANELGVHGRSGLYSVLADQVALQHAVVPTAVQNMYFLDAEPGIPNPADILSSKRFKRFAHDLKSVYDYVIFDTPPVGTFVDAAVASVAVDGVVLVVSVEKSNSHVATTGGIYYRRLGNVTKPDYPANDVYSPADNPDFSAKIVAGATENDIDLLEVYRLKEKLRIRDAGSALPDLADTTFLDNLNLIRMDKDEVRVTVAGLLFVGKAASIARLLPQAEVIYLHYSDEAQTEYDNRMDMQEPVISILDKLTERIRTYNRLTNVQVGLFRLEVYDFSEAVFQEALLNALAHRSYEDMAPIYVKHYPTKIVIENPGGFPGDINESNIITHQSIPRNKLIAMTLQHLKYVQRSGQGVDIMFQSMLTEGKPYPEYASTPNSVRLTLRSTMENQSFVRFIAETQDKRSKMFTLSELMILHYLREHQKITLKQAAKTIQETDDNAHKVLNALRDDGLLELNGKTYMLSLKVYETVKTDVAYVQDKTVSQIQAKDRILEYLKHKPSITNQKAQELCGYTKDQAYRILRKLVEEGKIEVKGAGRGRRYCLKENRR